MQIGDLHLGGDRFVLMNDEMYTVPLADSFYLYSQRLIFPCIHIFLPQHNGKGPGLGQLFDPHEKITAAKVTIGYT